MITLSILVSEPIPEKKDFENMRLEIKKKIEKLGVFDIGMTGFYHKIGSFQFLMSTPTPKFM